MGVATEEGVGSSEGGVEQPGVSCGTEAWCEQETHDERECVRRGGSLAPARR